MASDTSRAVVLALTLLILIAFAAPTARAGGLYLNEFGTPSMGVSGAGANATANDASTAFHNPAGMVRLKKSELMITGGLAYADLEFDPASDTPIGGGDGDSYRGPYSWPWSGPNGRSAPRPWRPPRPWTRR